MTRTLSAALLLLSATAVAAQPLPTPTPAPTSTPTYLPTVPNAVAELRDAALRDDYAWDIVEGLTVEVGQRMGGTAAEARAREWAVAKLRAMGFANVRVERFAMPVWSRGAEAAEILAPFPQKLAVTAFGNSASTPAQGIVGQIVAFDSIADLRAAPDSEVRGKIVFVSHAMPRTQDGSGYGFFGGGRADRGQVLRAARARSESSFARSAPTAIATRTPAGSTSSPARHRFRRARWRSPMPSNCSGSSSAAVQSACG